MNGDRRPPGPIRALFFDVDGVLTDGRIYLAHDGNDFKVFDTKDGHGIKMAIAAGLKIAWISGRTSRATARRARELGVHASNTNGEPAAGATTRATHRRRDLLAVDQQEGVGEVDAGAEIPDVDLDRRVRLDVGGAVDRDDDAGDGRDMSIPWITL